MILKKTLLIIVPSLLLSMSVQQVNEASDSGLGCIKGVGNKKLKTIRNCKITNLPKLCRIFVSSWIVS